MLGNWLLLLMGGEGEDAAWCSTATIDADAGIRGGLDIEHGFFITNQPRDWKRCSVGGVDDLRCVSCRPRFSHPDVISFYFSCLIIPFLSAKNALTNYYVSFVLTRR